MRSPGSSWLGFVLLVLLGCSACTDGRSPDPACEATARTADGELEGARSGGELWALPIGPFPPSVGEEFKLVFRVTGAGEVSALAVDPDGSRHGPISGPTEHLSSNFERPGDEWGAFFEVDRPGCWRILIERGALQGTIPLEVAG